MPHLALLRHGQSTWNLANRFTGWVDVDLTEVGEAQAVKAGEMLKATGIPFDRLYTSLQKRAIRTGNIALDAADLSWLDVHKTWHLNERHYGALTGLNKEETARQYGEEQVRKWRRSYDLPPPPLDPEPGSAYDFASDRRYAAVAKRHQTESLKMTYERVVPYWEDTIDPKLRQGLNLIIAAHGNSLRAIVKLVFDLSDEAIVSVEIPTGNPLLIDLDSQLKPIKAEYLDSTRAEPLPPLPA